jgi:hypothetical protein
VTLARRFANEGTEGVKINVNRPISGLSRHTAGIVKKETKCNEVEEISSGTCPANSMHIYWSL